MYSFARLTIVLLLSLLVFPVYPLDQRKLDSLISLAKKSANDTNKVNYLLSIGKELGRGDPDRAIGYCMDALYLARGLNFKDGEGRAFNRVGFIYFNKGEYDNALSWYDSSMVVMREIGDSLKIASAYNNKGRVFEAQGMYEKALESYLACLKIGEAIGNKRAVALVSVNLGNLYLNQNKEDKAYDYYKMALEVGRELRDTLQMSSAMSNLSIILRRQKRYDEAIRLQEEAILLKEKIGDRVGVYNGMTNLSRIHLARGEFGRAVDLLEKVYKGSLQTNRKLEMSMVLEYLGIVHDSLKQYGRAKDYYLKSLELSRTIGAREVERDAYQHLASNSYKRNDLDAAYEYLLRFIGLRDSLLNEKSQQHILRMQTVFETEKKDNEIKLLNKDNEVQAMELKKRNQLLWGGSVVLVIILVLSFFIYRSNRLKQKANLLLERKNLEIERQKNIIEEKNKETMDSINYARRIQSALLPGQRDVERLLPGSFVLFRPKDIVSGDFYWIAHVGKYTFFAAADCTGHGVPGGFMSMLAISLLNEIVNEKKITEPADILDMMRIKIIVSLKQKGEMGENKDGMDMVLCRLDETRDELVYAAANNPLWLIRKGECLEFPADKQPVGISTEHAKQFSQYMVPLEKGDMVYAFTDGYADQFGGPKGKKFKYRQLKERLVAASPFDVHDQQRMLNETFDKWKGNLEQVDDVCIIGLKV